MNTYILYTCSIVAPYSTYMHLCSTLFCIIVPYSLWSTLLYIIMYLIHYNCSTLIYIIHKYSTCFYIILYYSTFCSKAVRKTGALQQSFCQLTPTAQQAFLLSVMLPDLKYATPVTVFSMSVALRDPIITVCCRGVRCTAGVNSTDVCSLFSGAVHRLH